MRRTGAVLLTVPVLLVSGCALPGGKQDESLCAPLEESWNAFAADPTIVNRSSFEDALNAFAYDSSTSTSTDAARLAEQNLLDGLAGDRTTSRYFWNSLDLVAAECAEVGEALSFDRHGEPLQTIAGSGADQVTGGTIGAMTSMR